MQTRNTPVFRPRDNDYRYVEALKLWLAQAQQQHMTRTKLAEMAGMPRCKLSAFEAHPGRMAWVRTQLAGERRDDQWERMVDRAFHRGLVEGKIEWALFFARATGRFGPGETVHSLGQGPTAGPTVVLMQIPRPQELPEAPRPVGASSTVPMHDILDLTRR